MQLVHTVDAHCKLKMFDSHFCGMFVYFVGRKGIQESSEVHRENTEKGAIQL